VVHQNKKSAEDNSLPRFKKLSGAYGYTFGAALAVRALRNVTMLAT
jgi:hypothetical protein